MHRPDKVVIGGLTYKIEYTQGKIDGVVAYGRILYEEQVIKIWDNGHPDVMLQTLIHEILHGIGELYKIDMLNSDENHDKLDLIALALSDVLTRNGLLKDNNMFEEECAKSDKNQKVNEMTDDLFVIIDGRRIHKIINELKEKIKAHRESKIAEWDNMPDINKEGISFDINRYKRIMWTDYTICCNDPNNGIGKCDAGNGLGDTWKTCCHIFKCDGHILCSPY